MKMNHISCNLCGNDETKIILKQTNYKYFPRTIVRCLSCGLVYVNPLPYPEELHKLYQESNHKDICNSSATELSIECSYLLSVNSRIPLRLSLFELRAIVFSFLLLPILKLQAYFKCRRARKKGDMDYSRIFKILLSHVLLYSRHLIIRAHKRI